MKHEILFDPSFSMIEIEINPDEVLQAKAGVMVSRSENITMDTRMNAGKSVGFMQKLKSIFVAFVKKALGGESFFINEFRANNNAAATVSLSPILTGSILHKRLDNGTLTLQGGAYLASLGDLEVRVKFAGLKALFSGHGLFFLEITGTGDIFFSAYGGVLERNIDGKFMLDTGHLVGFDGNLDYKIGKAAAGLASTFFSGEGLVMNFSGAGKVYIQSRNVGGLIDFVNPRLPQG